MYSNPHNDPTQSEARARRIARAKLKAIIEDSVPTCTELARWHTSTDRPELFDNESRMVMKTLAAIMEEMAALAKRCLKV